MNMAIVKITEQQKEWALKVAAGVATLFLCYMAMIHPVFQNITDLRQSITDSQKRRELYQELKGLKENLESREKSLATLTERSQLLGKISDIAGGTQLHVETLTPRAEPEGGYIRLKMEMDGQGDFFSLLKFLQAVERSDATIRIRDVSMLWKPSADLKEGGHPLQIQLMFETLLKQRIKKNNA